MNEDLPRLSPNLGSSGIDFERYEFEALRNQVLEIINVGSAIWGTGRRTVLGALGVTIVVFLASATAMAWTIASLVALITFPLAMVPATAVSAWLVSRNRLDAVTEASSRVIETISMMHSDLNEIRAGAADVSVRQVGSELAQEVVVPLMFGAATRTASGFLGPFASVADRATAIPMRWVQDSVVKAISNMPDKSIGDLVDRAESGAPDLAFLGEQYARVTRGLRTVVESVARGSTVLAMGLATAASVPLVLWLLLVWWVAA